MNDTASSREMRQAAAMWGGGLLDELLHGLVADERAVLVAHRAEVARTAAACLAAVVGLLVERHAAALAYQLPGDT